jgi:hypothetical protein
MASNEIEILDTAASVEKLNKIAAGRALNRRRFMTALGVTGAVAGASIMSGCSVASTPVSTVSLTGTGQTDALNFLLNLKYLSATFYSYITTGADISASATGVTLQSSGAISGAPALIVPTGANSQQTTDLLNEIYFDEWNHLANLQSILGYSGSYRPAINLAATAVITASNVLSIARILEDVTVTAYNGIASVLVNSNVTYAMQLLGADSFHAGALRLVDIQNSITSTAVDSLDVPPIDPGSSTAAAAGPTATGAFFATAGAASTNATTGQGFAFSRTTSQVLALLYGAPSLASTGTSSGGYFPRGVNGNINTV